MSNTPIKRKSHALGEQCSSSQRLVEQPTRKQLILKSPETIESELIDIKRLPDDLMYAIHENGLYDQYLTIPKMQFTLPKTGDRVQHMLDYVSKYGKVHGGYGAQNWKSIKV